MRRRLPPLNALRLFEAAARHLSFKRAAEELLLTPSAVSHGLQALERWLGTPLFQRTAKGLSLTEAGARYFPHVQAALERIAAGTEEISTRRVKPLRISATPTFANRILLPLLGEFSRAHPDIAVAVDTSYTPVPLGEDGADVAIRMGRGGWPGLVARRLLRETLVPVCAPARHAEFSAIDNLDAAPLIHVTTVSEDWARWAAAAGRTPPRGDRGLRFDTLQMAFDAAAKGLGIALGRRPLVDAELAAGTLVTLWQREVPSDVAYWLVSSESRAARPDVRAFCAWMAEREIGAHTARGTG